MYRRKNVLTEAQNRESAFQFQTVDILSIANLILQFEERVRLQYRVLNPHLTRKRLTMYCLLCQKEAFEKYGMSLFEEEFCVGPNGDLMSLDLIKAFSPIGETTPLRSQHAVVKRKKEFHKESDLNLTHQKIVLRVMNDMEKVSDEDLEKQILAYPPVRQAYEDRPTEIGNRALKDFFYEEGRREKMRNIHLENGVLHL